MLKAMNAALTANAAGWSTAWAPASELYKECTTGQVEDRRGGCEFLIKFLYEAYHDTLDPAYYAAALAAYNFAARQRWGYPQLSPRDYPSDAVKVWKKDLDAFLTQ